MSKNNIIIHDLMIFLCMILLFVIVFKGPKTTMTERKFAY